MRQRIGEERHVDVQRRHRNPREQRPRCGTARTRRVRADRSRRRPRRRTRPVTIAVARQPDSGLPSRRPNSRINTNPASGNAGISQITSSIGPPSPLHLGEVVGGRARSAAQDRHDDAEADDDLGGRHDEHEEHRCLAVDVAESASRSATNVRLAALSISSMHMNITSGLRRTSKPGGADAEQRRGEQQVPRARRDDSGDHASSSIAVAGGLDDGLARHHDGAGHGDDQQHRRQLEREHVILEQVVRQQPDVRVARRFERCLTLDACPAPAGSQRRPARSCRHRRRSPVDAGSGTVRSAGRRSGRRRAA